MHFEDEMLKTIDGISKQNRYYHISILMLDGIREVLIISTERDLEFFKMLLGDGKQLRMKFSYEIQERAVGIAEAFIIGEDFI